MSIGQIFILIGIYTIGVGFTSRIVYDYFMIIKNYKEWIILIGLSLLSYLGLFLFIIFLIIKDIKQHYNNK